MRLEFQKEVSYFIDTFESHDNNVNCGRKITIIVDGKHRGVHALSTEYRGGLSQHCLFLMKQDC